MKTLVLLLGLVIFSINAVSSHNVSDSSESSESEENDDDTTCDPGLLLPVWMPQHGLTTGDRLARGLAYFIAMIYLFIGVSIVSDRFMESIEVITAKEKEVRVTKPNGEVQIVVVRVWNETVSNLTLMALGSSAPEILLSIIEIYAKNFDAGDLGPGTIVGSAAFNLLVIIAICVYVIPDGEVRKIKHLRVFAITATWSIFAYLWLLIILKVTSPGIVELWEGIVTLLFFPLTVGMAYVADRRLLVYKYLNKNYRMNKRGTIIETEGSGDEEKADGGLKVLEEENMSDEVREFEESRRDYIKMLRDLRKKHPNADAEKLEAMAREEILNKGPKSRAFYRMQATRKLTGGTNIVKKIQEKTAAADAADKIVSVKKKEDDHICKIFFDPGHYNVLENIGQFKVTVAREGGDLGLSVLVDYMTEDGTASGDSDYKIASGTLFFAPNETQKTISLEVIDDDVFEEDEHFYVRLSNARFADGSLVQPRANGAAGGQASKPCEVQLSTPFMATVIILDDDHHGIFNIQQKDVETVESIGSYDLKICRWSGARGRICVPYETEEGTAKPGKDYVHIEDELIFENNETEKFISVQILEEDSYEKDVLFYVNLKEPRLLDMDDEVAALLEKDPKELTEDEKITVEGLPKLGTDIRSQIRVKESKEFKNSVDKLMQRANASLMVGTSSWKEQFTDAVSLNPEEDEDGNEQPLTYGDYLMHILTVFWKIMFAFIPPTTIANGYVAFVVSILAIGVLTAVIGDLASHLGCSVGLKDSVTAIAFVALGTSIPDTFASKVAAVQDEYADASVGNVTGSNAVNVFLGIGIAWTMAAIYHGYIKDVSGCLDPDACRKFTVDPGSLAYSVTVFCSTAFVAIFIMVLRRNKAIGGELGGPKNFKYATSAFFFGLWLLYVLMSSLEAYGIVQGF